MPSGSYKQSVVKCPFYISDITQPPNLFCEGIEKDNTIALRFRKNENKNHYMDTFCIADYSRCKIFKLVNEKYE